MLNPKGIEAGYLAPVLFFFLKFFKVYITPKFLDGKVGL